MFKRYGRSLFFAIFIMLAYVFSANAAGFNINLSLAGFTASQHSIFNQAENYWESILTGYQPGISIPNLDIDAVSEPIDGEGGILGSAGPTAAVSMVGFTLATNGIMEFDSADLGFMESANTLYDVIRHEIAHVIGFGTLWSENNVYVDGTGQYTGAFGLGAYQNEFNPLATHVPVELEGGIGTADGHWNENFGGAGTTGFTDSQGRDLQNELMTGWLNTPVFVSNTTLISFQDIGYEVSTVPIPTAAWLLGSGLMALAGIRQRFSR